MPRPSALNLAFAPRFRRRAIGSRSHPAVQRVKEATAEVRKVATKDPALAAAGAVLFLEKISPALEQVDSSSDAIGTAVNKSHAILTQSRVTKIRRSRCSDRNLPISTMNWWRARQDLNPRPPGS